MPATDRPAPGYDRTSAQALRSSPAPPEPSGELLVAIPRGEEEQLRVTLDSFEGHKFVSIRVWQLGQGGWWPTKKGCTVRVREIGQVINALGQAAKATGQGRQPRGTAKGPDNVITPRPDDHPALPGLADPLANGDGDCFDEF